MLHCLGTNDKEKPLCSISIELFSNIFNLWLVESLDSESTGIENTDIVPVLYRLMAALEITQDTGL
jgi:hypothetical protein